MNIYVGRVTPCAPLLACALGRNLFLPPFFCLMSFVPFASLAWPPGSPPLALFPPVKFVSVSVHLWLISWLRLTEPGGGDCGGAALLLGQGQSNIRQSLT